MAEQSEFALYVVAVEGHVVPRYGVPGAYIGVRRGEKGETPWVYTGRVEAITHKELARFRREYSDALKAKALTKLTAEEAKKHDEERRAKRDAELAAEPTASAEIVEVDPASPIPGTVEEMSRPPASGEQIDPQGADAPAVFNPKEG